MDGEESSRKFVYLSFTNWVIFKKTCDVFYGRPLTVMVRSSSRRVFIAGSTYHVIYKCLPSYFSVWNSLSFVGSKWDEFVWQIRDIYILDWLKVWIQCVSVYALHLHILSLEQIVQHLWFDYFNISLATSFFILMMFQSFAYFLEIRTKYKKILNTALVSITVQFKRWTRISLLNYYVCFPRIKIKISELNVLSHMFSRSSKLYIQYRYIIM